EGDGDGRAARRLLPCRAGADPRIQQGENALQPELLFDDGGRGGARKSTSAAAPRREVAKGARPPFRRTAEDQGTRAGPVGGELLLRENLDPPEGVVRNFARARHSDSRRKQSADAQRVRSHQRRRA